MTQEDYLRHSQEVASSALFLLACLHYLLTYLRTGLPTQTACLRSASTAIGAYNIDHAPPFTRPFCYRSATGEFGIVWMGYNSYCDFILYRVFTHFIPSFFVNWHRIVLLFSRHILVW